jgi:hypothetical protein
MKYGENPEKVGNIVSKQFDLLRATLYADYQYTLSQSFGNARMSKIWILKLEKLCSRRFTTLLSAKMIRPSQLVSFRGTQRYRHWMNRIFTNSF